MLYSIEKNKNILETKNNKPTLLRVLNASPKSPAMDIWINGEEIRNLSFSNISNFISLPNGNYDIKVFTAETDKNLMLETRLNISSNTRITLAINGIFPDIKLLPINETVYFNNNTGINLRFVHLSPNVPSVDVFINEKEVFGNLKYEDFTEYLNIPSGEYSFEVRSITSNNTLLALEHIVFEEGLCETIYALGLLNDDPQLNVNLVQDNSQNRTYSIQEDVIEEGMDEIITNSTLYSTQCNNITSRFLRSNDTLVSELSRYGMDTNLSEYLAINITDHVSKNLKRYTGESVLKANHVVYDLKLISPWLFEVFNSFDIYPTRVDELVRNIALFSFENL